MLINIIIAVLAVLAIGLHVYDWIKSKLDEYTEVESGIVYLYVGKAAKYLGRYPSYNILQSTEDGAMVYVSDFTLKEYFNKRKLF